MRGRLPERVEQRGHVSHVLRPLDLGHDDRPDPLPGAAGERSYVVREPRALDGVHAQRHRRAVEYIAREQVSHEGARFLLRGSGHGVLEVHHDLVGTKPGGLRQHAL